MPPIRILLDFQPRDGHQQRFTCGSQHRPPSNDGTFTLFVPSSEVVPGRLALLLAARCDSTSCGEQTQSAQDMGSSLENGDDRGLRWTTSDATIGVRRVIDSNPRPVGSSGARNPTDALNLLPLGRLCKSSGPGGVSSSPLLLLYGFRRLALFNLIPKNYLGPSLLSPTISGPGIRV